MDHSLACWLQSVDNFRVEMSIVAIAVFPLVLLVHQSISKCVFPLLLKQLNYFILLIKLINHRSTVSAANIFTPI